MSIRPANNSASCSRGVYQILILLLSAVLILSACDAGVKAKNEVSPELETEPEEQAESSEALAEKEETMEPDVTPTPILDAASTMEPTPFPMFDIIGGRTIMLSITEEKFLEYADFLKEELNLNNAAAAGILSNIQCESGFNPNKVGDMGNAYGLCQWRGARLDQMVEFCEENDLSPISMEGQLRFLVHDLEEVYIYAYDQVRLCPNSEAGALQATYNFCALYEVPSDPEKESKDREELTKLLIFPRLCELREEKEQ